MFERCSNDVDPTAGRPGERRTAKGVGWKVSVSEGGLGPAGALLEGEGECKTLCVCKEVFVSPTEDTGLWFNRSFYHIH